MAGATATGQRITAAVTENAKRGKLPHLQRVPQLLCYVVLALCVFQRQHELVLPQQRQQVLPLRHHPVLLYPRGHGSIVEAGAVRVDPDVSRQSFDQVVPPAGAIAARLHVDHRGQALGGLQGALLLRAEHVFPAG